MVCQEPTSTPTGMSRPRPLAASSAATAVLSKASAPMPYTVSVGITTSRPSFSAPTAEAIPTERWPGSAQSRDICGQHNRDLAVCLERGACSHLAPPNAASFLISRSVTLAAADHGWRIFYAYADMEAGEIPAPGEVIDLPAFRVETATLNHRIPCLAFAVSEPRHLNIRTEVLEARGWGPGPWLSRLKAAVRAGNDRLPRGPG